MDFPAHWTFGCVPVVEILKDTGGHYLFKKQISPPQSHRGSFNHTAPIGLFFPLFPVWDLMQKVAPGHLTLDWNNELADRNCHIPSSIAPVLVRSPFSL